MTNIRIETEKMKIEWDATWEDVDKDDNIAITWITTGVQVTLDNCEYSDLPAIQQALKAKENILKLLNKK